MIEDSVIYDDQFWKILTFFEQNYGSYPLEGIEAEMDASKDKIFEVISFLNILGINIELEEKSGKLFANIPRNKPSLQIDLTLSEWLSFQAHFPLLEKHENKEFNNTFIDKLKEITAANQDLDLFYALTLHMSKDDIDPEFKFIINTIENALVSKVVLRIDLQSGKSIDTYLHRIVYIENELCLIGEECTDRCLVYFPVGSIDKVNFMRDKVYDPNFSDNEVLEFLNKIRDVNENEHRLVLKVFNKERIENTPKYQFFGNTFVTTNMDGDMIWAASVENNPELYEWLVSLENDVEVLDPPDIKSELEEIKASKKQAA